MNGGRQLIAPDSDLGPPKPAGTGRNPASFREAMMKVTIFSAIVFFGLTGLAGAASVEGQNKILVKAEQRYALAGCQLAWLREHMGESKSEAGYFGFIFECLSKSAGK